MRLAALTCALLLVLAGCGGGTAPASEPVNRTEPMQPDASEVVVNGGEIPVDATVVFDRVRDMTDEQTQAPTVYVESASTESATDSPESRELPQFWIALGITPHNETNPTGQYVRTHGATSVTGDSVTVYEWVLDDEVRTESTLAHEFVHVVQFQNGWLHTALRRQSGDDGDLTYDAALAHYLLQEGAAVYVQDAYDRTYLPDRQPAMAHQAAAYENASAYARLLLARYHYGAEYVAGAVDSPADLETLHNAPPVSAEQMLHTTDDPVENVTVTTADTGNWVEHQRDRQGELFLRIALRTELNRSTAVAAAAGWGTDRRITYTRDGATGTAWVLHWDDAANATEFERAFRTYLDEKATERDGIWYQNDGNATYRLERTSNETTVVLLGNETFVRTTTATRTGENQVEIATRG